MKKIHYMTSYFKGKVDISFVYSNGVILVICESKDNNNYGIMIVLLDGTVLWNIGFNADYVSFYSNMICKNAPCILKEYNGEYNA